MVAPLNPDSNPFRKIQSQRLWRGRNGSIRRWILMRQVRMCPGRWRRKCRCQQQ
ncbi:Uncharacterised protein [Salmonella enterica subsp. enterica]|nr:Uncharacterised protein [Salmonella enterica subsp. enterica] [Salmonella enterica subsp. enterica serovar Menston]